MSLLFASLSIGCDRRTAGHDRQGNDRLGACDPMMCLEPVEEQFERMRIVRDDLEREVKITCDIEAFLDIGFPFDELGEAVGVARAFQADEHDRDKLLVQFLRIQDRAILLDDTCVFQFFQTLADSGHRHTDLCAEVGDRFACILLQESKDFYINIIHK